MSTFQKTLIAGLSIVTAIFSVQALASTAANTSITNTVTVNFEDTANNAQPAVQASVDITVNLLASAPLLSSPADVASITENTGVDLTYTITGTSNGPDTYDFSSVDSRSNMDADATFSTPSVTLGGTTLAAAAAVSDGFIVVPYDGASDNDVNGLVDGDTIVIGGVAYVIGTIDEAGTLSNNTVQIPLTTTLTTTGSIGDIIGEQTTVDVTVNTDSITAGATGTHTVTTTATSQADNGEATAQGTATVVNVRRPVLTITKWVRNMDDLTPPPGAPASISIGADTWYAANVSGQPGDEMQYLIVIDNTGAGASDANNVVVSDPIPQFTSFVAASIALDDDGSAANAAAFVGQSEGVDDGTDAAELDTAGNGTVFVYAGTGGVDTPAGAGTGTGGTVAAGDVSRVIFNVTID